MDANGVGEDEHPAEEDVVDENGFGDDNHPAEKDMMDEYDRGDGGREEDRGRDRSSNEDADRSCGAETEDDPNSHIEDDPNVHIKDDDRLKKPKSMPKPPTRTTKKRKQHATDHRDNTGLPTKKRKSAKIAVYEKVIEEEDDDEEQDPRWIKLEEDIFVSLLFLYRRMTLQTLVGRLKLRIAILIYPPSASPNYI